MEVYQMKRGDKMKLTKRSRMGWLKVISIITLFAVFSMQKPFAFAKEPVPPTERKIYVSYDSYESPLKIVSLGAFWGGILGLAVAGAVNLIGDDEIVRYGPSAGVGILAGLGYGIYDYHYKRNRHLVHNDPFHRNGTFMSGRSSREQKEKRLYVGLFSYNF